MNDIKFSLLIDCIATEVHEHYEGQGIKGLEQFIADAELGRLVRQMSDGLSLWPVKSETLPAWAVLEWEPGHIWRGDTPEEALRNVLGEETNGLSSLPLDAVAGRGGEIECAE